MLNPINRESLTTNLLQRYENTAELARVPGFNAKDVGTDRAITNFINGTARGIAGNDVHSKNFNRNGLVPGFTQAAFNYSRDVLKHDNTKYRS